MSLDVSKQVLHQLFLNGVSFVEFGLLGSIRVNYNAVGDQRLNLASVVSGDVSDAKPPLSLYHLLVLSLFPTFRDPLGPFSQHHCLIVCLSSLHKLLIIINISLII